MDETKLAAALAAYDARREAEAEADRAFWKRFNTSRPFTAKYNSKGGFTGLWTGQQSVRRYTVDGEATYDLDSACNLIGQYVRGSAHFRPSPDVVLKALRDGRTVAVYSRSAFYDYGKQAEPNAEYRPAPDGTIRKWTRGRYGDRAVSEAQVRQWCKSAVACRIKETN